MFTSFCRYLNQSYHRKFVTVSDMDPHSPSISEMSSTYSARSFDKKNKRKHSKNSRKNQQLYKRFGHHWKHLIHIGVPDLPKDNYNFQSNQSIPSPLTTTPIQSQETSTTTSYDQQFIQPPANSLQYPMPTEYANL